MVVMGRSCRHSEVDWSAWYVVDVVDVTKCDWQINQLRTQLGIIAWPRVPVCRSFVQPPSCMSEYGIPTPRNPG